MDEQRRSTDPDADLESQLRALGRVIRNTGRDDVRQRQLVQMAGDEFERAVVERAAGESCAKGSWISLVRSVRNLWSRHAGRRHAVSRGEWMAPAALALSAALVLIFLRVPEGPASGKRRPVAASGAPGVEGGPDPLLAEEPSSRELAFAEVEAAYSELDEVLGSVEVIGDDVSDLPPDDGLFAVEDPRAVEIVQMPEYRSLSSLLSDEERMLEADGDPDGYEDDAWDFVG